VAISVVIVEDNPEFLHHLTGIIRSEQELSLAGIAVTGAEALALISSRRADVYLVDLGLPDMDGTEVIRHAVKTHVDCEVMVLTVFGDDEHVISSVEAGATGYVLKDSTGIEIIDAIRSLCAGGSPVSPTIARTILKKYHADKNAGSRPAPPVQPLQTVSKEILTEREAEILRVLAKGLSFNEIGDSLSISPHTVARHVKHVYRKLAVHSRGEAVYEATKLGLIRL
jgi:DNA-binding NarL/FixJ family response regulator